MPSLKHVASLLVVAPSIAACGGDFQPTVPSDSGYDAIRFRRVVQLRDHAINIYTFRAGTVLVADRRNAHGQVYCGTATINDSKEFEVCVGFSLPATLIIGPGGGFKQVERSLDPAAIERIKVRA